ncbi:hypothetical protein SSX86_000558 [Deinandra increscens subsp. villosa]|uniref:Uncharacterized protein n=1 Tax=Deinandra increscens subsp. villosa TaxID=3103831 RepID=A0AAP0DTD2_9ASTR
MLLAVEGGRFFSSSASGYTNGLNLLLLGQKKEEKPMRVSPWNHHHLVDQTPSPHPHNKTRCACESASFTCFGCAAGGPESPSVGPALHQQEVVTTSPHLEKFEEKPRASNLVERDGDGDGDANGVNEISLKSSLKKRGLIVTASVAVNISDEVEPEPEPEPEPTPQSARRSVHWTDVTGGELCEIREFEPSEHSDSDNEFENNSGKTCSCIIM